MRLTKLATYARYVLGAIRLVNGGVALLSPAFLTRRLGAKEVPNTATQYALRLFGVRTVIIGAELLFRSGPDLDRQLRQAPFIHASDTVGAFLAGRHGDLAPPAARKAVVISAVNTALALLAIRARRY